MSVCLLCMYVCMSVCCSLIYRKLSPFKFERIPTRSFENLGPEAETVTIKNQQKNYKNQIRRTHDGFLKDQVLRG